jgi:hypothetical protein
MKQDKIAAIVAAISAYAQQEELLEATAGLYMSRTEKSPWWFFGQQELMRSRTNLRVRKDLR